MENIETIYKRIALRSRLLIWIVLLLFLPLLLQACNDKPPQKKANAVKVWCIRRSKAEVVIRIENKGTKSVFVPEEFWLQYSKSQDTLLFESVYKKQSNEKSFYYYNQFGANDVTGVCINGLKPTSIKKEKIEVNYNQFKAPRFIEVKPKGSLVKIQRFDMLFGTTEAVIRLYTSNFTFKSYSYDDFIKFEGNNSFIVNSNMYESLE